MTADTKDDSQPVGLAPVHGSGSEWCETCGVVVLRERGCGHCVGFFDASRWMTQKMQRHDRDMQMVLNMKEAVNEKANA